MFRKLFFDKFMKIELRRVLKTNERLFGSTAFVCCDKKSGEGAPKIGSSTFTKYEPFKDDRSPVILDVEEERRRIAEMPAGYEEDVEEKEVYEPFAGISPEQGRDGVIDIKELVEILRKESAVDLFVCQVPPEYRYVRHMVIVTGKSVRHMLGMAEFVRRVYKYKMKPGEIPPMIEGKKSRDWIALDLGNIALHIFSRETRELYDLESLWALGRDCDVITNAPENPLIAMIKQNVISPTQKT